MNLNWVKHTPAPGVVIDSGSFSGALSEDAARRIIEWFESNGWGERTVQYRLRDWLISLRYNTAIAALMEYLNTIQSREQLYAEEIEGLLLILAPFAPHIAEELWERIGRPYSIHQQAWPKVDPGLLVRDTAIVAVQINGRTRATIELAIDAEQDEAVKAATSVAAIRRYLGASVIIRRIVYVPGQILNLVTG